MDLDYLAGWLEQHPEIAEIVVTEVTTTTTIHALPAAHDKFFNYLDGMGYQ